MQIDDVSVCVGSELFQVRGVVEWLGGLCGIERCCFFLDIVGVDLTVVILAEEIGL